MRRRWPAVAGVVVVAALGAAACGSRSSASSERRSRAVHATTGAGPSKAARMICADEVRRDLAGVLATKPTQVTAPTWSNQEYACSYVYPDGTVSLSVKELPDTAATKAYFDALGNTLGRVEELGIGQGAYATPDGSLVVRKDRDALVVDMVGLPGGFTRPARSAADAAALIATTVLRCWQG